jgi:hypothetical protein
MSSTKPASLLFATWLAAASLFGSWLTAVPAQAAENSSQSKQPAKPKAPSQDKPKAAGQANSKTRAQDAPGAAGPREARQPVPIPQECADLAGVQRQICVECNGVALHMRVVCHQRVFWTTCKGKRLFEDSYCQSLQDQQGARGEGG